MRINLLKITSLLLILFIAFSCKKDKTTNPATGDPLPEDTTTRSAFVLNHACTKLTTIPLEWINKAKTDLHIAYAHTSHGSQIIDGMTGLETWKGSPYLWNDGVTAGELDIDDYFVSGDLGNPDWVTWESRTRTYLASHTDVNVVIWSWCGEVSDASEANINTYLSLMTGLETDFPDITFVYMTGHLDGTGLTGQLHIRNEQIRKHCLDNSKMLYDFADIESYDPDGNYYLDKRANDACKFDSNNSGGIDDADENWAINWQNAHPGEWFNCASAHSEPLNANMKAYAAWWLWARLAGWDGN